MSPRKTEFAERINVFFSPEQLKLIKSEAKKFGLTVSAYIRMLVVYEKKGEARWLIKDYKHLICSHCGYNLRTGWESMEEAEEKYSRPLDEWRCPHCGYNMSREDGSSLVLFQK